MTQRAREGTTFMPNASIRPSHNLSPRQLAKIDEHVECLAKLAVRDSNPAHKKDRLEMSSRLKKTYGFQSDTELGSIFHALNKSDALGREFARGELIRRLSIKLQEN